MMALERSRERPTPPRPGDVVTLGRAPARIVSTVPGAVLEVTAGYDEIRIEEILPSGVRGDALLIPAPDPHIPD